MCKEKSTINALPIINLAKVEATVWQRHFMPYLCRASKRIGNGLSGGLIR